jgi:hypothetical protein
MRRKNSADQARLRLTLFVDGELWVPRRYAQSTSGRQTSHRTTPLLSRSKLITSDSPKRPPVDSFFRMYPIVVPQRVANESCSAGDSELRKVRRAKCGSVSVMGKNHLPAGNVVSSQTGNLPAPPREYACRMPSKQHEKDRVSAIRRRKLRELVDECGSQAALAQKLSSSHLRVLGDTSYLSRALSGKSRANGGKNITGDTAAEIERIMGKSPGWMSRDDDEPPLSVEQSTWDQLDPSERDALQRTMHAMITGFLAGKQRSRKTG